MLLWINGPFGIGKTTTAHALRKAARARGTRAWIYDPEPLGFILQRVIPRAFRPGDFREQGSWRWGTWAAIQVGLASPSIGASTI